MIHTHTPQDSPHVNPLPQDDYGAKDIQVVRGLDVVRQSPGMFIGDTDDGTGLHHMAYEVIDNAIDEALAGYCTSITVAINANESVTIRDNGRGIPVDIHAEEGVSAAEVILTRLHAGGKFNNADAHKGAYTVSGGLHGVGVSVVNALSEFLKLTIWRHGSAYAMVFNGGVPQEPIKVVGSVESDRHGTEITFLPSPAIFKITQFDFSTLEHRLRELAFLNPGLEIILQDHRHLPVRQSTFHTQGGLVDFVTYLNRSKVPLHTPPIVIEGQRDGIKVSAALSWTESYHETMQCFTNTIPQREGGTHLAGFRSALTRLLNNYSQKVLKKKHESLTGDDIREGLTAVLSVKVPEPRFGSQTKDKLVSSAVKPVVDAVLGEELELWFEQNPIELKKIIMRAVQASLVREASRKARDLAKRKTALDVAFLPGKLADCSERNPAKSEIFIVEGDSAGGIAKQGRQRHFQAILPLRGKILNVERARFDKMLASDQIGTLITALGTGIGADDFSAEKARYHRIVIMTDADVDGSHIRTLLLTFFFRHMRPLLELGYIYIAQPPLYSVKRGQSLRYFKDDQALETYLLQAGLKEVLIQKSPEANPLDDANLQPFVTKAAVLKRLIEHLSHRLDKCSAAIIQHVWCSGALQQIPTIDSLKPCLKRLQEYDPTSLWTYDLQEEACTLTRQAEGEKQNFVLPAGFLELPEINKLRRIYESSGEIYRNPLWGGSQRKGLLTPLWGPSDVVEFVLEQGKKGIYIQRYKGLGEMNGNQLWETTMDPQRRNLLQVRINDPEEANQLISILLGKAVEPRFDMIQENAHISSLDI